MAIRDYWVYQKRDVQSPWAFYVVKEFDKRAGASATVLDYTFYHENVGNQTKSVSHVGLHCDTIADYAEKLAETVGEFANVTDEDIEQLRIEIERILLY